jgi:hypothetical protein
MKMAVTLVQRKLYNEELSDLFSSHNIVREFRSGRMRWEKHVVRLWVMRNAYKILVANGRNDVVVGERIILKWILKNVTVDWTHLS